MCLTQYLRREGRTSQQILISKRGPAPSSDVLWQPWWWIEKSSNIHTTLIYSEFGIFSLNWPHSLFVYQQLTARLAQIAVTRQRALPNSRQGNSHQLKKNGSYQIKVSLSHNCPIQGTLMLRVQCSISRSQNSHVSSIGLASNKESRVKSFQQFNGQCPLKKVFIYMSTIIVARLKREHNMNHVIIYETILH